MYIVVGKNKNSGVCGNDSGNLSCYFELGWELMVTRIKAIKLLKSGTITAQDIIVTFPDRMFLYTKIFNNVITYNEYTKLGKVKNMKLKTTDLVSKAPSLVREDYSALIKTHLDLIRQVDYCDLSKFDISKKFICLLIRRRDWCSERNGDENYYMDLIQKFSKLGVPVFLGGLGTEKYAVGDNVKWATLQEWASLMNHPNCMALIGSTSGASTLLGQLCCSSKILVNDPAKVSLEKKSFKHPLLGGKDVHFSGVPFKVYTHYPSIDELNDDIVNYESKPWG